MNLQEYNTPILFLIFNRPESTQQVFAEIKKVRPSKLYIAADGPRNNKPDEREKCEKSRAILKLIDWDCEVKTLLRNENLGCKKAVSSAITWFFTHEEEGVILEDDCVPNSSFFTFCQTLLEKYKSDARVMHIGGANFQPNTEQTASYYFSNYNHVWGWATWKRCWNKYDPDIKDFPEFLLQNQIDKVFGSNLMKYTWLFKFWKLYRDKIDTWDYQWTYTIWNNGGISIIPAKNLVSNIGFNEEASHTKVKNDKVSNLKTEPIDSIVHPEKIVINHRADKIAEQLSFNSSYLKKIVCSVLIRFIKLKLFLK